MITPDLETPLYRQVQDYTYGQLVDVGYMVSAIRHVVANDIPGAIVECGVWRGGMLKAAVLQLEAMGVEREVWGYDTFAGMTETGPEDGEGGKEQIGKLAVPYSEVRAYLGEGVRLVKGDVRQTLLQESPEQIAILRLDVDWHDNTRACMKALWPRLSPGGVLLVDDYDFWEGCKKAVDAYLGPLAGQMVKAGTGSGMVKP